MRSVRRMISSLRKQYDVLILPILAGVLLGACITGLGLLMWTGPTRSHEALIGEVLIVDRVEGPYIVVETPGGSRLISRDIQPFGAVTEGEAICIEIHREAAIGDSIRRRIISLQCELRNLKPE